jgi:6-phosphogluconolactonase (cycloisomerase 2 family)
VANAASGNISEYAIDSKGVLNVISGSPFSISANATALTMTPDGNLLYALDPAKNLIVEMSINSTTGVLTQIGTQSTTSAPTSMAVDPKGKYLYLGNSAANSISVYGIGTDGKLTEAAYSPVAVNGPVHSVAVSAKGTYLFASVPSTGSVYEFALDATTGTPTLHAGSPISIGTNPDFVAVSPDESFAVILDQSGLVNRVLINSTTGALSLTAFSPFTANADPVQAIVDSSNSYIFILSTTGKVINTVAFQTSGAPYQVSSTVLGAFPSAMAISGSNLYAVNEGDDNVMEFSLTTGVATVLSPTAVAAGTSPAAIAVR